MRDRRGQFPVLQEGWVLDQERYILRLSATRLLSTGQPRTKRLSAQEQGGPFGQRDARSEQQETRSNPWEAPVVAGMEEAIAVRERRLGLATRQRGGPQAGFRRRQQQKL